MENLYGLGSWVGTAPWGPAGGMETLGICMAIKEIRQGINTAFLPLVGAAERGWTDWVLTLFSSFSPQKMSFGVSC